MSTNYNVGALFSDAARTYDFLNHFFSLQIDRTWRQTLVAEAALRPDDEVLDVCTGTADVAIGLAPLLKSGRVVGIDFCDRMLDVGRKKILSRGLEERIALIRADALSIPFDDGLFDAVTVAFGLRNLSDRERGIGEMARVLKPGGRLLILEFSPPPDTLSGRLYAWYLGHIMPLVGGLISGTEPTYRYLHASISGFLRPAEVRGMMERAGFLNVRSRPLTGGITYLHSGVRG